MAHLKPGVILKDRYKIAGLIGAGGMGAVYLAEDARLEGRRCAVKEQTLDEAAAQVGRKQVHQEASLLARLDHPGLPKVSDYFFDETTRRDYLVMDYVPGQNLEQLMKEARRNHEFLAEETVLEWIAQLCDILTYLHNRRPMVLHRDIKPANIKLTPESRLKLVDFGLAKPFDPGDPRTVTGLQGLGSLPYTPLEQYVGHIGHTDARADLYALGATCYHLLTGQSPASAHDRFLNPKALTPPESLNPHISLPTSQAILQAMALHPNDRPASVEDWRAMLVAKTATRPVTAKSARAGATSPHPPASSSFIDILKENALLFSIALLLFILAVVMTFSQ